MKVKTSRANGIGTRMCGIIRSLDSYGQEVRLTLEGQGQAKTCVGGLLTVVSYTGLLAYFLVMLSQVINRENFQVQT